MLTKDLNELITRTGLGTSMGNLMRRYWVPALLSEEVPEPDGPPVQVRILGEELVAFRDTQGRIGLIAEAAHLVFDSAANDMSHIDTLAGVIPSSRHWREHFAHLRV